MQNIIPPCSARSAAPDSAGAGWNSPSRSWNRLSRSWNSLSGFWEAIPWKGCWGGQCSEQGLWAGGSSSAGDVPTLHRGAQRHRQCLGCHCHCPTGVAVSPAWAALPWAGSDRGGRAFIGIYPSLCPQLQSRGLREGSGM